VSLPGQQKGERIQKGQDCRQNQQDLEEEDNGNLAFQKLFEEKKEKDSKEWERPTRII